MANDSSLDKNDLIARILGIELEWFLSVNPMVTSECQQNPEAFKLIRGSNFETWSEKTLQLYLDHLHEAQSQERNLMREKYAKMQNLIPCQDASPTLNSNRTLAQRNGPSMRGSSVNNQRPGDVMCADQIRGKGDTGLGNSTQSS